MHDKTCRNVPPDGPDDFLSKIRFEGDKSFEKDLRTLCSEFADIFSDKLAPQAANLKPFEINLPKQKWEVPPKRTPVRPESSKKEHYLRTSIEEMLENDVIERAKAAYYSHPIMVNKAADTFRTCINYRALNECIEPVSFPLPNIKHLLERIGNKKPDIYGVMNLTASYHHAPLYAPHRNYTAFICFIGVFLFTRLPFGPCRAPLTFRSRWWQRSFTVSYISVVRCISTTVLYMAGAKQSFSRRNVFERFRLKNLRLKVKKCRFGPKCIEYVGRVIDKDGLSMSKEKIETVLNFPLPKEVISLRGFLGLANYFRQFVPSHSEIVKPLLMMVDSKALKRAPIHWTPEGTLEFNETGIAVSRCPLMYFTNDDSPIKLYTDASDFDISGVLFHIVNDVWRPIAFRSKSQFSTKINWSTIQEEAYAIFYCCQRLDYFNSRS